MENEVYERERFIQVLMESDSCSTYEEACEIAERYESAVCKIK